MKRLHFFIILLLTSLLLSSCEKASPMKGSPMVRYHARPGNFLNYRYMKFLFEDNLNYKNVTASILGIGTPNTAANSIITGNPGDINAAVETSSSSVSTKRLIDYPSFMDASGFTTTIKNTPAKVVVLNSSLAEIWMLAGGSIDITIKETITRGLVIESEVKVIDQPTTDKSNYELLLSYDPDLVILDANNDAHLKLAETLRVYDIPVFVLRVDSFLNYLSTLSMFTKILNTPNNFEEYGNKLLNQVEAIVDSTQMHQERKKVLLLSTDNSIENTDLSKHFVYHMLEELGALPVTANDVNNTLDNEASETKDVDLILDLNLKENIELFSYLPNQRWAQVYQYLVDLLYGEEKE